MRKLICEGEGEGPELLNQDATARTSATAREIWRGSRTVASETKDDDGEERLRYSEGEHEVDRHVVGGDFRVDVEGTSTFMRRVGAVELQEPKGGARQKWESELRNRDGRETGSGLLLCAKIKLQFQAPAGRLQQRKHSNKSSEQSKQGR